MEKKVICIIIVIASALNIWAQKDAGTNSIIVKGGVNHAAMFDVENKMGYLGGVELQHFFAKRHAVSVSALLNYYKVEQDWNTWSSGNRKVSLAYLSVPVMYNFYPVKGLCLKAGLEGNLLVYNHVRGGYGMAYYNTSYKQLIEDQADSRRTARVNDVRFAVPVAVSYEYSNVILELGLEYGLNDVSHHDKVHYTMNALFATLGIRL